MWGEQHWPCPKPGSVVGLWPKLTLKHPSQRGTCAQITGADMGILTEPTVSTQAQNSEVRLIRENVGGTDAGLDRSSANVKERDRDEFNMELLN